MQSEVSRMTKRVDAACNGDTILIAPLPFPQHSDRAMTPQDAIRDGRLAEAIELQQSVVLREPTAAARLMLFELLTVTGQLHDAREQLFTIESDDPNWRASRRQFMRIVKAQHRRVRGKRTIMQSDPPPHFRLRWRAFRGVQYGEGFAAIDWVDRADRRSPELSGHVDGREFEGLRDIDDRFGSVLEAFIGSEYVWIGLEELQRIRLAPAVGILDAAFRPAQLRYHAGEEIAVVLPLIYPGSEHADGALAAGLETDWTSNDDGPVLGMGARIWMMGDEEIRLSECRQIDLRRSR